VAIPYAMSKRRERGDSLAKIYLHLVIRVAIMIFFGMMINGSLLTYDRSKFELTYSVLQMLALGYLVAAILFLHFRLGWQILATLVMLLGYWALLAFVPGEGHEVGKFAPGCNVGDWVTERLFGQWRGHQVGWVVGILGHASTAMLGVFAGQLLRSGLSATRKIVWLVLLGVFCTLAGMFWGGWFTEWYPDVQLFGSNWKEWVVWFPIIKNRWTSSYALYAGGISYLLLALFYLIIDVWGFRRWAVPFMAIGANSIFAYMAWGLCSSAFRSVSEKFLGGLQPYVAKGCQAIADYCGGECRPEHIAAANNALITAGAMAVLWLLLGYMYSKKTFIRI
jgi:predicted acyltransferase